MSELKNFVSKVPNFFSLDSGSQVQYFVYYLQVEKQFETVKAKDISLCFDQLHLNPYSNIAAYLNNCSKKSSKQQFLKKKTGYILYSAVKGKIDAEVDKPAELKPSNSLFPLSIFDNTRKYLNDFSKEASCCYDFGLFTSCLFMLRKITETLIIELYESKGIQSKIKNVNGDYFQLSDLIKSVTNESSWKLTKIVKENLPKIKLLADSSVHSKRFSAKKPDIDEIKINVRIAFEELINHIDYARWNAKP
ncbi:hypothetical protein [Ferruginibacter sp.]|nr:hypothetical protein [Ferruginibacter sp.]